MTYEELTSMTLEELGALHTVALAKLRRIQRGQEEGVQDEALTEVVALSEAARWVEQDRRLRGLTNEPKLVQTTLFDRLLALPTEEIKKELERLYALPEGATPEERVMRKEGVRLLSIVSRVQCDLARANALTKWADLSMLQIGGNRKEMVPSLQKSWSPRTIKSGNQIDPISAGTGKGQ